MRRAWHACRAAPAVVLLLLAPWACSSASEVRDVSVPQRATAPARVLYVAPDGDDDAPGTRDRPVRTIGKAADLARPGTEVDVAPGTYRGSVTTTRSGTADQRIAFVSQRAGAARIVGDGTGDAAWQNDGDYVDVSGFDISGSDDDGLVSSGSYVRLVGNTVHDFANGNCISTAKADYDFEDIDVIGNVVHGCGGSDRLIHGIYVSHPGGVVSNNISYDNAGYGIHCWHNCNELVISNNLVHDNGDGGIVVGQGDAPNNGRVAADGFTVSNNIAIDNAGVGITESGRTGRSNRYLNNLIAGNGRGGVVLRTGSASGTLTDRPRFVAPGEGGSEGYRLQPGSPGVDGGVRDGSPSTDLDGTRRPAGNGYDVGPYER